MAWYRAGTVTVTNGSTVVTGAGTDFVANTSIGEAFLGPDGRTYEIAAVVSATQLTLASGYMGGTAGAQGYATMPTSSFARDLALGAAQLLNTFAAVRDGIGAGLIPDGTLAAPALRFAADQDTGVLRVGNNRFGLATGGSLRLLTDQDGNVSIGAAGATEATGRLHVMTSTDVSNGVVTVASSLAGVAGYGSGWRWLWGSYSVGPTIRTVHGGDGSNAGLAFARLQGGAEVEAFRFDSAGNLLVGAASGSSHKIEKTVALNAGGVILRVGAVGVGTAIADFVGVSGAAGSLANCAMRILADASTGRSINAGGTINASGADYAEYMTKAAGCGTIAAGDVCGVDADGHLTRTWADAVSFVVKSTDPAYVGGDTWAAAMPPRPERGKTEAEPAFATRLAAWEAQLEAERVKVDRIAFAGQVPVNVAGSAAPGDYLIAAANGSGIKAVAVSAGDITFDQYRRRIGKVWAIRGGRPWVDVQHG